MKFLLICDPSSYGSPLLDIPKFYQQLSRESRVELFHLPAKNVLNKQFDKQFNSQKIKVASVSPNLNHQQFLELDSKATETRLINEFDLVFCRTLKPFPPGYLEQLSSWEKYTTFVNSPSNKIEQIEPDFLLKVAKDWIPETITTQNWDRALSFFNKHDIIVAKQFNSCGGRGVFKIWIQDGLFQVDNLNRGTNSFEDFHRAMEYIRGKTAEPLLLMRYLKQVNRGDKRIVVVDGEIYGAYVRRSRSGHWINNVSGDGECILADITTAEQDAIEATVGEYRHRGLHTLGYDFLLDDDNTWRISEINAGNIGGFARLEMLTNQPVMNRFIDWLIKFTKSKFSKRERNQNLLAA